jgi:hypothetical protein
MKMDPPLLPVLQLAAETDPSLQIPTAACNLIALQAAAA